MAILSEMLQFPHHTCARGSTVEKPFLVDLAGALGIPNPRSLTKYELLDAAHLLVHGRPMPDEHKSTGSTVTDRALQAIIDGVIASRLSKVSLTDGGAAARIAVARAETGLDEDPFDPLVLSDERKTALRSIKVRSGQRAFREALLRAYGGRCAITGCDVAEALEAAHITPYRGPRTNVVPNGLCLRADLHRLWDTGRLAVHESSHEVLLDASMIGTDYSLLAGDTITLPANPRDHPSSTALEAQRRWCGL
jgi:putative restriction endonuclease